MTDHFAVFGLPQRPRLDHALLKDRYLALAAQKHPDASSGDAGEFASLREAYEVLENPALRLRHLSALFFPESPRVAPGSGPADLFLEVGAILQQAKALQEKRVAATSALSRAVLAGETRAIGDKLGVLLGRVKAACEAGVNEIDALDVRWPEVAASELEKLASKLIFLGRWKSELAEWEFKLAHE